MIPNLSYLICSQLSFAKDATSRHNPFNKARSLNEAKSDLFSWTTVLCLVASRKSMIQGSELAAQVAFASSTLLRIPWKDLEGNFYKKPSCPRAQDMRKATSIC